MRCRTAKHRDHRAGTNAGRQSPGNLGIGQLFAIQILHDQFVITLCGSFNECHAGLFGGVRQIIRYVARLGPVAKIGPHLNQVHHTLKAGLFANRKLDRNKETVKLLA